MVVNAVSWLFFLLFSPQTQSAEGEDMKTEIEQGRSQSVRGGQSVSQSQVVGVEGVGGGGLRRG